VASTRDMRRRIRSVKSTEQITRAMKMVAAVKLRRTQERILAARPFINSLRGVLARLATHSDATHHPLLAERAREERVDLLVVTGDRGFCGSFNTNILKRAQAEIDARHGVGEVGLHLVGRKARDHFRRRGVEARQVYADIFRTLGYEHAIQIGDDMIQRFTAGELDAVYLIYNEFKSAIQQRVVVDKLLPLPRIEIDPNLGQDEYLYEPDPATLFSRMLPRAVQFAVFAALLESNAAENGARMAAMDAATSNARDMIDDLTVQMNRIRQAAITKEIIEVVSGAQALS